MIKLFAVSGGGNFYGVDVTIYGAEDINALGKMLEPDEEVVIERVNSHLPGIFYTVTTPDFLFHVEEEEVKPGRLFSIVE